MNRKDFAWLSGSAILVGLIAVLVGSLFGPMHWLAAGIAIGLMFPTAFGTLWIARSLAARHPLGSVMGMMIGTLGRLIIGFGGGSGIFFINDVFRDVQVGYWIWLLAIYVIVLVVETALLAKPIRTVNETPNVKG